MENEVSGTIQTSVLSTVSIIFSVIAILFLMLMLGFQADKENNFINLDIAIIICIPAFASLALSTIGSLLYSNNDGKFTAGMIVSSVVIVVALGYAAFNSYKKSSIKPPTQQSSPAVRTEIVEKRINVQSINLNHVTQLSSKFFNKIERTSLDELKPKIDEKRYKALIDAMLASSCSTKKAQWFYRNDSETSILTTDCLVTDDLGNQYMKLYVSSPDSAQLIKIYKGDANGPNIIGSQDDMLNEFSEFPEISAVSDIDSDKDIDILFSGSPAESASDYVEVEGQLSPYIDQSLRTHIYEIMHGELYRFSTPDEGA